MATVSTASQRDDMAREYVLGLASAAMIMAFFGTGWGLWGSTIVPQGAASIVYYCAVILLGIMLFVAGVVLGRTARSLPEDTSPEGRARRAIEGRRYGRLYEIVFGLEILLIIIASYICSNVLHNPRAVASVTAIIVGLHFLPLAKLFQVWPYYVTGAVLTVLGLVTLLAIPVNTTLGAGYAWIGVPGIGSAITLYVTGIVAWLRGRGVARTAQV